MATLYTSDESDYTSDVSSVIEQGSSYRGTLTSWTEYRTDAYLMYNKPSVSLENIIKMRRVSGQARALCSLITLPVRLALQRGRWIAPPEGDADEEVDYANNMWFLPPALGGMTTPANTVISQIGLSISDGFAPFELVSQVPKVGPLKGKKTIRKLAYRDPRTVTLLQDANGGYAGFRQIVMTPDRGSIDKALSPGKTVLFTVNGHENPLYGVSYFESAYPHFEAMMKWYYISEMAGQFAAVPGRIGTVPRGAKATDVVAFKQALESFYFNTTMLMKEGYTVTPFQTSPGFDFLKYIDHHTMLMSKSVLASFFESDQRTVLVENNTQDAAADLFLLSMETIADEYAAVLTNHVMPKYINENFGTNKYPVFKPGPLSGDDRRKISSLFEKVAVSGILNTTPEMVRELEKHVSRDLGLDVDYEDIEAREEEAAIQQAEQAELLAAQAQQTSIDQERAAEGGIPNSPEPTSEITSNQPVTSTATQTTPGQEGEIPAEANNGVSLSEMDALNALVDAANKLFGEWPLEDHPVDEGF